jgi:hypothetical protein
MARIKLRFLQGFVAHGKAYYYFRKPGCARVKLPGSPFSDEFMKAYQAALSVDVPPSNIGATRSASGTIATLVAAYAGSDAFRDLAAETRRTRWAVLRRFGDEHGGKRVNMLKREHVEAILRGKRPHPRANFLKMLRPLLQFAVSIGWCKEDPTRELRATVNDGITLDIGCPSLRGVVQSDTFERVALVEQQIPEARLTDARCVLQHCLEHRLELAGRAADGFEHLRGRSLLLQRFAQVTRSRPHLVEQPHVLDRNHRLIGKGGEQLDLALGERTHRTPRQREHADRCSFPHKRHGNHGVKFVDIGAASW